jgi:2-polyprenyl-3-methyl-5-hydroxy-6-metoxy-1,4-benzoquinol methylase
MIRGAARSLTHALIGNRRWMHRNVRRWARGLRGRRILELGSGRQDLGKERYSVRGFFDPSNEFVQSDVDPRFGHAIVDATSMEFRGEFDVILCLNVLEHVYDYQTALDRIHMALRPGGMMILQVPAFFPLHDEPHDFWRFTEHAL